MTQPSATETLSPSFSLHSHPGVSILSRWDEDEDMKSGRCEVPDATGIVQESTIEAKSRRWLTFVVVLISVSGIVALGIAGIIVKTVGANDPFEKIKYVSATILPLLASWVGTILAFYFSKENLVAATQSVTDLTKALGGMDKLKAISVR